MFHGKMFEQMFLRWLVLFCAAAGMLLIWMGPAHAGPLTGTLGSAFLQLSQGVRASALANTYTAISDDPAALSWNPAGIMDLKGTQLAFSFNSYVLGTSYSQIHLTRAFEDVGVFGVSYFLMDYGSIAETTATQRAGTGNSFQPQASVLSLGYGKRMWDLGGLGISVKLINQNIATYQQSVVSVDGSVMLDLPFRVIFPNVKTGLTIQNMAGGGAAGLPQETRLGFSARPLENLLSTVELKIPRDDAPYLALASEYWFYPGLSFRGGLSTREQANAGLSWALGLGAKFEGFSLDYAFTPVGELGDAHRFGIAVEF